MHRTVPPLALALLAISSLAAPPGAVPVHGQELSPNGAGIAATTSTAGRIDRTGPFFQSLGTNGRSCASCHVQKEGWSITPAGLRERFRATSGLDPVFSPNDGAVSPLADVSNVGARQRAYRMLLSKGVVRVGIGIPAGADFELATVDDPYHYASAAELSLFRRPLPSTNLAFLSTVMWDGRETFTDPNSPLCIAGTTNCFATIPFDLADQANSAVVGHAQGGPLPEEVRQQIVAFETALTTAQLVDAKAGRLDTAGAHGGAAALSRQPGYFGINDVLAGDYRTGLPFTPDVMRLFDAWPVDATAPAANAATAPAGERWHADLAAARAAIARGQVLFNSKAIAITGVKGLNDVLGIPVMNGTCTTCHDSPNAGSHSVPFPLDLGLTDASRRTPDLPLYTLRSLVTGETIQTTDPGRALVTGKFADVGKFKGPVLRGLAARAPYFHNGSARRLDDVVTFYDQRFSIGLTDAEKADLAAFLQAL